MEQIEAGTYRQIYVRVNHNGRFYIDVTSKVMEFISNELRQADVGVTYVLEVIEMTEMEFQERTKASGSISPHDHFNACSECDLPDACRDFGCAIKTGVKSPESISDKI